MLDDLIAAPRLVEVDSVVVAAPPEAVWQRLRHGDLMRSPLVKALFVLRALPERLRGKHEPVVVRLDDIASTPEHPGFQILGESVLRQFTVGAIGRVWEPEIPFVHVAGAAEFARFREPGYVKVAWQVRVLPWGQADSRVEVEVRVDATDAASFERFRTYFRLVGPGSHFIRRALLSSLQRELGTPEGQEGLRPLPGDELLVDAVAHATDGITIAAPPERVWPWLVQMGCRRAGFYSIDWVDNGGQRSARELHPEWQTLQVGQVVASTPDGDDGFEVLQIDEPRSLILGGLFDATQKKQLPFSGPRPESYWHITWAFVLEPLDADHTRLHVRARAAFSPDGTLHAAWIRPVHHLMQRSMLEHLAERVEGRLPRDDWHDVLAGLEGVAIMLGAWLSPPLRAARSHWGLDEAAAARSYPGDALVPSPDWGWTHGAEVDAPSEHVWPWMAQIGADRGGFYSYQWLENLAGCEVQNAERVRPEWALVKGDALLLHPAPNAPRFEIVEVEAGRHWLAHARVPVPGGDAGAAPAAEISWLLQVEPRGTDRCRIISRYRVRHSAALRERLAFGPVLMEPVGFAMDRQMLLGLKERAERA